MSFVCDRVGIDNILDGFDLYQAPCFSISQGKEFKFSHVGDDVQEARDVFEQNLNGIHHNSTALYKIKLYKTPNAKGEIDRSTPEVGSFTFRINSSDAYAANRSPATMQASAADPTIIKMLQDQQTAMMAFMQQMSDKMDTIGEPPIEDDIYSKIGNAVESFPALKDVVDRGFTFLERLTDKLFSGSDSGSTYKPIPERRSPAVSGIKIPEHMNSNDKMTAVMMEMIKAPTKEETGEKLDKLSEAFRKLLSKDGDLYNTILKLSELSDSKYNMAKNFL